MIILVIARTDFLLQNTTPLAILTEPYCDIIRCLTHAISAYQWSFRAIHSISSLILCLLWLGGRFSFLLILKRNMSVIIRHATIDDATAINRIICDSRQWSPYFHDIFGDELQNTSSILSDEKIQQRKDMIKNLSDQEIHIVAIDDEKIVWILYGSTNTNESLLNTDDENSDYAETKTIYVDPLSQGHWVWKELMHYFEQWAQWKWMTKCIVKTLSNSEQSNHFYKGLWYNDTWRTVAFERWWITTQCTIYEKII